MQNESLQFLTFHCKPHIWQSSYSGIVNQNVLDEFIKAEQGFLNSVKGLRELPLLPVGVNLFKAKSNIL